MQNEPQKKFEPEDLAIRFRIEWVGCNPWAGIEPTRFYQDTRPVVRGLEVVKILSQEGVVVTWTNLRKKRANGPNELFVHRSNRAELIALDWFLDFAGAADKCAVPITAEPETVPPAAPASFTD